MQDRAQLRSPIVLPSSTGSTEDNILSAFRIKLECDSPTASCSSLATHTDSDEQAIPTNLQGGMQDTTNLWAPARLPQLLQQTGVTYNASPRTPVKPARRRIKSVRSTESLHKDSGSHHSRHKTSRVTSYTDEELSLTRASIENSHKRRRIERIEIPSPYFSPGAADKHIKKSLGPTESEGDDELKSMAAVDENPSNRQRNGAAADHKVADDLNIPRPTPSPLPLANREYLQPSIEQDIPFPPTGNMEATRALNNVAILGHVDDEIGVVTRLHNQDDGRFIHHSGVLSTSENHALSILPHVRVPDHEAYSSITNHDVLSDGDPISQDIDSEWTGSSSATSIDSALDEGNDLDGSTKRAAELLIGLLTFDDIGCGQQSHTDIRNRRCPRRRDEPCYRLNSTYSQERPIARPCSGTQQVGLSSDTFPTPGEISRSRFIRDDKLRNLFEGSAQPDIEPKSICIHTDHCSRTSPQLEFDIDAFIATMDSFNGFQKGQVLKLCFTKETRFNISTDIHIRFRVNVPTINGRIRPRYKQVQRLPHLYLGTVPEFPNSTIFAVFPGLFDANRESSWLNDQDSQLFLDEWLAICRQYTSQSTQQAMPPNNSCAEGRARAKGIEHRSTQRNGSIKQLRYYPLKVEDLQTAWAALSTRFREKSSGLGRFRESFILVNSKNTKLEEPTSALSSTLLNFQYKMTKFFRREHSEYYADIGAKILPTLMACAVSQNEDQSRSRRSASTASRPSDTDEDSGKASSAAHTYLWKACCLEKLSSRIQTECFGGKAGKKQTFNNGFLRDATSLTMESPVKSWLRKSGVLYFQAYNSAKEIEDAQQVHPFDRPLLSNLSLSAEIVGPRTLSVDRGTLVRSYCHSKARVRNEYRGWRDTPLGARFEVRASREVIDAMCDYLERAENRGEKMPQLEARTPDFLWCVPTQVWCDFMYGNYDKMTSLIEMIILSSPRTGVPLPTSQLLFAIFTYLEGFSNSNPARKSLLWVDSRDRSGREEVGLNLRHSISKYGYGWIAAHIDWQGLRLLPHAVGRLVGCGATVGAGYHEAMRHVQDTKAIMELVFKYILASEKGSRRMNVALKTAAHYILRQYRRDVLGFLARKKELHSQYEPITEHDKVKFCHSRLLEVLVQRPYYKKTGRICGSKSAVELFEWIMGIDPHTRKRTSFDGPKQKEWRRMLMEADRFLGTISWVRAEWLKRLCLEFERYMFSIPYPDPEGSFLETNSTTGQRTFYAAGYVAGQWRCLDGNPRLDEPPPYPKTLFMSLEELDLHLSEQDKCSVL